MANRYWLVKQEPDDYPWAALEKDGRTAWTGVRSFPARIHLRAMKAGDLVAYYHSGETKEIVGVAKVVREAYPDPTSIEGDWSAVDLSPVKALVESVPLAVIRNDAILREMAIVRMTRLSVSPVTPGQWERLLELAKTRA